ncbi:hypothetical protein UFOVP1301_38 [uncultured Caudovirales phage]|uniref:Uncharacterized protein n=1 Tax=uncultured Caudovirales phage TaxID=2100421 RepID=A0A6J5QIR1_9CAUD|nr:hypothetical protein UFOVP663_23 [uncultured Caudovirales phage]CAB4168792.1 hypothetical protein UFOVP894_71 [uncultured Caudovirales phage]CAB4181321.1 hypothetical protein UFOVP1069_29 [uncultured Caudovirales phage]CAB4195845.1 hypothetical protein UFOVP1301_38 [uncultured Caudovirales phage]CAB4210296.1 hypothetical protein UFOVP1415_3 [uncultured Caudovirales phage]
MGNTHFSGPVWSANGFIVGGDQEPYVTVTSTDVGVPVAAITGTINPVSPFGSNTNTAPSSAQGVKGQVYGSNETSTATYYLGVMGRYLISGTNASTFPKAGVMGVVGDTTTTADAAVMAFLDGDGGLTTANAGYGISMTNSAGGSGFNYGMDLSMLDTGAPSSLRPYKIAQIRLAKDAANGNVVIKVVTSVVDGTASGLGIGSLGLDSTAGKLFVVDASGNWQVVTS